MLFIAVLLLRLETTQAFGSIQIHLTDQKIGQASTIQVRNFFAEYTPNDAVNDDDWPRNMLFAPESNDAEVVAAAEEEDDNDESLKDTATRPGPVDDEDRPSDVTRDSLYWMFE